MKKAVVRFDASRPSHRIQPYLHGHFIEHLGECVYGGIWVGPDSSIPNEAGLRHDVVESLKALGIPVLRWPGGCFADQYHWREGIGPPQERPVRRNVHWLQRETNAFGTEEFIRLCRHLGAEPYIALNIGSGTVQEAADWVEYCNSDQSTTLTRLREGNGSPGPHKVRFWGVGNETWGCGGNMTPEQYADQFAQYATFLRATDPEAKLVLCGSHRDPEWDHRVLAQLGPRLHLADHLSVHCYSGKGLSDRDGSPDKLLRLWRDLSAQEQFLRQVLGLIDAQEGGQERVGLILDEWGTWYEEARVENGLTMANTLADALFAAASLHVFHALGERLFMANLAQAVNVLQCLIHTKGELFAKTATYYVFLLLRPHQGARRIAFEVQSAALDPTDGAIAQLSASLSRDDDGRLYVSLVNRSPTDPLNVQLEDASGETVRMEKPQVLRSPSLAGENFPGRPHQVSPVLLEDGQSVSWIPMPEASIVAGYIA